MPLAMVCEGSLPLERLTSAHLRRLSLAFRKRTGVALDGWRPRHLALLSDESFDVVATLTQIMQQSGHLSA